jgi:hypothetical protein
MRDDVIESRQAVQSIFRAKTCALIRACAWRIDALH